MLKNKPILFFTIKLNLEKLHKNNLKIHSITKMIFRLRHTIILMNFKVLFTSRDIESYPSRPALSRVVRSRRAARPVAARPAPHAHRNRYRSVKTNLLLNNPPRFT